MLRSKALIYNSYFLQNNRLTEIIRHKTLVSYKHCNFSHVCPLVKMASKTVTRSIGITIGNKTQNKVKIYVYFTEIFKQA